MSEHAAPLLEVRDLCVAFGEDRRREVVRHVDLDLTPGEILGIVGASGSGKTTTLRAIVGHLPRGAAVTSGSVRFQGVDLVTAGSLQNRYFIEAVNRSRRLVYAAEDSQTA